jgi:hypothetical protein
MQSVPLCCHTHMSCPGNQQKELHQARAPYKFHQPVAKGIWLASRKGVPFATPLVPIAKNTLGEKPRVQRFFRSWSKLNVYSQILCNTVKLISCCIEGRSISNLNRHLIDQKVKQRETEGIKTGKLSGSQGTWIRIGSAHTVAYKELKSTNNNIQVS